MEEIVANGDIPPDEVHVPGVYVQAIVDQPQYEKRIERRTLASSSESLQSVDRQREKIVRRAARELTDGMSVNLGIGSRFYFTDR